MKPKADKIYRWKLTVCGLGPFPFDMLRYDGCYPFSSADAAKLERNREYGLGIYEVVLVMNSVSSAGPTVDRWKSFLWHVVSCERF